MSTLIVPCVGRKIMNGIPQYLNRHPNGKLLIERSIEVDCSVKGGYRAF